MKIKTVSAIIAILCLFLLSAIAFASCGSITTTEKITVLTTETVSTMSTSTQTIEPAISRDQALAIASQFVPTSSILQATISVTLAVGLPPDDFWQIEYNLAVNHAYATYAQLTPLGWSDSELSNIDGAPGYGAIGVNIDAETGGVLRKNAGIVQLATPPPVTS